MEGAEEGGGGGCREGARAPTTIGNTGAPSWDVVPYELAGTYIHKSADTAVRGRPCGPVSLEAPRLT